MKKKVNNYEHSQKARKVQRRFPCRAAEPDRSGSQGWHHPGQRAECPSGKDGPVPRENRRDLRSF